MAPQVPESAQLAYSIDILMVFEPSGAPLDPSGGKPTTRKRSYVGKMTVGAVKFRFSRKNTKSDGPDAHFTCI